MDSDEFNAKLGLAPKPAPKKPTEGFGSRFARGSVPAAQQALKQMSGTTVEDPRPAAVAALRNPDTAAEYVFNPFRLQQQAVGLATGIPMRFVQGMLAGKEGTSLRDRFNRGMSYAGDASQMSDVENDYHSHISERSAALNQNVQRISGGSLMTPVLPKWYAPENFPVPNWMQPPGPAREHPQPANKEGVSQAAAKLANFVYGVAGDTITDPTMLVGSIKIPKSGGGYNYILPAIEKAVAPAVGKAASGVSHFVENTRERIPNPFAHEGDIAHRPYISSDIKAPPEERYKNLSDFWKSRVAGLTPNFLASQAFGPEGLAIFEAQARVKGNAINAFREQYGTDIRFNSPRDPQTGKLATPHAFAGPAWDANPNLPQELRSMFRQFPELKKVAKEEYEKVLNKVPGYGVPDKPVKHLPKLSEIDKKAIEGLIAGKTPTEAKELKKQYVEKHYPAEKRTEQKNVWATPDKADEAYTMAVAKAYENYVKLKADTETYARFGMIPHKDPKTGKIIPPTVDPAFIKNPGLAAQLIKSQNTGEVLPSLKKFQDEVKKATQSATHIAINPLDGLEPEYSTIVGSSKDALNAERKNKLLENWSALKTSQLFKLWQPHVFFNVLENARKGGGFITALRAVEYANGKPMSDVLRAAIDQYGLYTKFYSGAEAEGAKISKGLTPKAVRGAIKNAPLIGDKASEESAQTIERYERAARASLFETRMEMEYGRDWEKILTALNDPNSPATLLQRARPHMIAKDVDEFVGAYGSMSEFTKWARIMGSQFPTYHFIVTPQVIYKTFKEHPERLNLWNNFWNNFNATIMGGTDSSASPLGTQTGAGRALKGLFKKGIPEHEGTIQQLQDTATNATVSAVDYLLGGPSGALGTPGNIAWNTVKGLGSWGRSGEKDSFTQSVAQPILDEAMSALPPQARLAESQAASATSTYFNNVGPIGSTMEKFKPGGVPVGHAFNDIAPNADAQVAELFKAFGADPYAPKNNDAPENPLFTLLTGIMEMYGVPVKTGVRQQ